MTVIVHRLAVLALFGLAGLAMAYELSWLQEGVRGWGK